MPNNQTIDYSQFPLGSRSNFHIDQKRFQHLKLLSEFYYLKSKLLENEEQIVKDMQGNSIEEKTVNIINWFMHNVVKEKPKSNSPASSKSKRKRGNQKTFSIELTQEDESNLTSVGCRIRMCVGYDDKGKMSAVIITPK